MHIEGYKPDLIWFDGDWDFSAEQWRAKELREQIFRLLPSVILNSRLNGYGDYATPEQGVPIAMAIATAIAMPMPITTTMFVGRAFLGAVK
ncbi:MAG: alpha-L-fucosidase [Acidobacteriia bacterium]|nr:alpha-L-fucosidase [Terriglobia bacterium]